MKNTTDAVAGRVYMQNYRSIWREQGFKDLSVLVHVSDYAKVRAYSDVVRAERLLALAEAGEHDAIEFIATRNCPKLPSAMAVDAVRDSENKAALAYLAEMKRSYNKAEEYKQQAIATAQPRDEAFMIAYLLHGYACYKMAAAIAGNSADV